MEEATRESSVDKDVQHGERWAFNDAVTDAFDDMLKRSIPQYDVMRRTVFDVGCRFVKPQTDILDIGCSRGEALQPFVREFGAYNRYVGVEVSRPMLDACRKRFENMIERGFVVLHDMDLRTKYPPVSASLTLAVLTVQFTPIEYRQEILRRVYDHTVAGGAFVIVEKVIGETARLDKEFVDLYLKMKAANGYTHDEIERKRLALEGVLVPVTAKWNEDLLRAAGFRDVDCFWRWCNFSGWVAVK